ncbi:MAG: GMP reductase [Veillonella sp.]|nr:GMP reductase [Veillonella sp.]
MINTTNIFDYEDVQLIPNKCIVSSRSECDTHVKLGKRTFRLPVVPANMQTIIDEELAEKLAREGYFYIMHRFQPERRMDLKKNLPETFIIAGNVGTPEAVRELENAGADATKVGIGPGKVCITKLKTGFGTGGWQLAAVRWCAKAATKPIIADGGIRDHGDIAKSIRFGATMVMIGSLFAGHEESPGEEKIVDGKAVKEYFGSASEFQKGERKNVEGKKIFIDSKGSIFDTLTEMEQDLQSAISYAGGTTLQAIRKVDYVLVKNSIFNGDR